MIGHHQAAIKRYADVMDWREAGRWRATASSTPTPPRPALARPHRPRADDVVAFARLAEQLLALPIFYLEYSGTYGSPEVVRAVRRVLGGTRLWYGGGIRTPEQAAEMAAPGGRHRDRQRGVRLGTSWRTWSSVSSRLWLFQQYRARSHDASRATQLDLRRVQGRG